MSRLAWGVVLRSLLDSSAQLIKPRCAEKPAGKLQTVSHQGASCLSEVAICNDEILRNLSLLGCDDSTSKSATAV
jgi:hypothetical protein